MFYGIKQPKRAYEIGEGIIKDVVDCTCLHLKETDQKEK